MPDRPAQCFGSRDVVLPAKRNLPWNPSSVPCARRPGARSLSQLRQAARMPHSAPRVFGYLATALLMIEPSALHGQTDTTHIRRVLEQRYAQQDSAIAHRDLAAFLATLAPQYVVQLRNGETFTRPRIDSAIARDMRYTRAVRLAATNRKTTRRNSS